MTEVELIVPLVVLHLIAMTAFVGLLAYVLFNDDSSSRRQGDGGRGDGPPRWPEPIPKPPGGPPLASATPARVRLREPRRLPERVPGLPRRRSHESPREPVSPTRERA